jgi:hypothetical protein
MADRSAAARSAGKRREIRGRCLDVHIDDGATVGAHPDAVEPASDRMVVPPFAPA